MTIPMAIIFQVHRTRCFLRVLAIPETVIFQKMDGIRGAVIRSAPKTVTEAAGIIPMAKAVGNPAIKFV